MNPTPEQIQNSYSIQFRDMPPEVVKEIVFRLTLGNHYAHTGFKGELITDASYEKVARIRNFVVLQYRQLNPGSFISDEMIAKSNQKSTKKLQIELTNQEIKEKQLTLF